MLHDELDHDAETLLSALVEVLTPQGAAAVANSVDRKRGFAAVTSSPSSPPYSSPTHYGAHSPPSPFTSTPPSSRHASLSFARSPSEALQAPRVTELLQECEGLRRTIDTLEHISTPVPPIPASRRLWAEYDNLKTATPPQRESTPAAPPPPPPPAPIEVVPTVKLSEDVVNERAALSRLLETVRGAKDGAGVATGTQLALTKTDGVWEREGGEAGDPSERRVVSSRDAFILSLVDKLRVERENLIKLNATHGEHDAREAALKQKIVRLQGEVDALGAGQHAYQRRAEDADASCESLRKRVDAMLQLETTRAEGAEANALASERTSAQLRREIRQKDAALEDLTRRNEVLISDLEMQHSAAADAARLHDENDRLLALLSQDNTAPFTPQRASPASPERPPISPRSASITSMGSMRRDREESRPMESPALKEVVRELRVELQVLRRKNEKLTSKREEDRTRIASYVQQIENLEAQREDLAGQLSQVQRNAEEQRRNAQRISEEKIRALGANLEEQEEGRRLARRELAAVQAEVKRLVAERTHTTTLSATLQDRLSQSAAQLRSAEERAERLSDHVNRLEADLLIRATPNTTLQAEHERLQSTVSILQDENAALKVARAGANHAVNSERIQLLEQLSTQHAVVDDLRAEATKLRSEAAGNATPFRAMSPTSDSSSPGSPLEESKVVFLEMVERNGALEVELAAVQRDLTQAKMKGLTEEGRHAAEVAVLKEENEELRARCDVVGVEQGKVSLLSACFALSQAEAGVRARIVDQESTSFQPLVLQGLLQHSRALQKTRKIPNVRR